MNNLAKKRKLGRPTASRRAMLRSMVTFLFENGRIETTLTRAKEVKSAAEKMITVGRTNDLSSKRRAMAYVTKEGVVKKLFDEIVPKYEGKHGGCISIVKIGVRRGDAAPMAIVRLV